MSQRHQGRRRAGVIAATGFTALIGTGVLAFPASAHVPAWSNTCDSVTVHLTDYNANAKNTVEVKAAGQDLIPATAFTDSFSQTVALPDHSSAIPLELIVKASDDRQGKKGWSVDEHASADACQTTPPPTSPPPTTPPPTTPPASPSQSATPSPTHSAPVVPVPSTTAPGLADTGASSATPVIAGVAAAVVVAGGALVLVSRKRRGGSH